LGVISVLQLRSVSNRETDQLIYSAWAQALNSWFGVRNIISSV